MTGLPVRRQVPKARLQIREICDRLEGSEVQLVRASRVFGYISAGEWDLCTRYGALRLLKRREGWTVAAHYGWSVEAASHATSFRSRSGLDEVCVATRRELIAVVREALERF